ncbi:MAG: hypothetical protein SFT90_06815 [Rickettsiales bacterium]|nr:hypothetical protein [Rickettsiales bacterium]
MNINKQIGVALIILSMAMAGYNSLKVAPKLISFYFGEETRGKIICKKSSRKINLEDIESYSVEYQFFTPIKQEFGSSDVWESYYNSNRIGDEVTIKYYKDLPFFNVILEEFENPYKKYFSIGLIIANIALIIFSFYYYTKYSNLEKKKKIIRKNGSITIGKIDEIEEYTEINNKKFFKIHYSFDDILGTHFIGEETQNEIEANKLKAGDEVKVYYDSNNPQISTYERIVSKFN